MYVHVYLFFLPADGRGTTGPGVLAQFSVVLAGGCTCLAAVHFELYHEWQTDGLLGPSLMHVAISGTELMNLCWQGRCPETY